MIKINKALATIQYELKAPKKQYNSFGKYNYRNAEDILEAVKPLLSKHNATLRLVDEIVSVADRVYVKATAIIQVEDETLSTTAFAREEDTKKGMDASQITGSASSYARKYALNGLFAIDDTKDADFGDNQNNNKTVCEKCGGKITKVKNNGEEWTAQKFAEFSYEQTQHYYCAACFNKVKNGN